MVLAAKLDVPIDSLPEIVAISSGYEKVAGYALINARP